jgi:hypothetical protein
MNFWRIRGMKRSVFPKSAELNCAFSAKIQYSQKSVSEGNSKFNLHFYLILGLGLLLLNDVKNVQNEL